MTDETEGAQGDETPKREEDVHIPAMQRILDSPFLLLFLGVTIPTVFYLMWGLIEIAHVPIAPASYAAVPATPAGQVMSIGDAPAPETAVADASDAAEAASLDAAPLANAAANDAGEDNLGQRLAHASAADGERAAKRCVVCHTVENGGASRIGPNLWEIVGRDIASIQGFNYSPAMAAADGDWTFAKLDEYLANPRQSMPGNRMADPGFPNGEQRADVIMYLRNLSASPAPLPQ